MIRRSYQQRSHRYGIQLLELIIAMTTSSILMSGVAASMYLASRSQQTATTTHNGMLQTQQGLTRFRSELAEAKSISDLGSNTLQLVLSDRDNDGSDELHTYSWQGPGTPLQYSDSSRTWTVTDALDSFSLNFRQTAAQTSQDEGVYDPPGQYLFQSFKSENAGRGGFFNNDSGFDLSIAIPETYVSGDLLVAALVVEDDQADSIACSPGWTKLFENGHGQGLSLAAFYTYTNPGSADFTWANKGKSHGVIVHFRTPLATATMAGFGVNEGKSNSPAAPLVSNTEPNCLALRVIGTDQSSVPEEATNVAGHVPVYFRSRVLSPPSIGVAFRSYAAGEDIPEASFGLTSNRDFACATLVFSP